MATLTTTPMPSTPSSSSTPRSVLGLGPGLVLRLEGAALLVAATLAFGLLDVSWWWYAGLLLAPDIAMVGYLVDARVGALSYNLGHSTVLPLAVGAVGVALGSLVALAAASIWLAHIGLDRMLGYGLKHATGFADTHLSG